MQYVAITLEGRSLRLEPLPEGGVDLRAEEGPPGRQSVFERVDLAHGRIALRVPDGRYLARHVEHPGKPSDEGAVVHLVDEVSQCAAFEELPVPGGYVSLRACDLRFLGVHTSGRVVAGRISNGTWERFRYVEVPEALWEAGSDEPGPVSTAASAEAAPVRAVAPVCAVAPAEPDPLQPRSALGGWGMAGRSLRLVGLAAV